MGGGSLFLKPLERPWVRLRWRALPSGSRSGRERRDASHQEPKFVCGGVAGPPDKIGVVQRLTTAPGVGPLIATAFVATLDEAARFGGAHYTGRPGVRDGGGHPVAAREPSGSVRGQRALTGGASGKLRFLSEQRGNLTRRFIEAPSATRRCRPWCRRAGYSSPMPSSPIWRRICCGPRVVPGLERHQFRPGIERDDTATASG